VESIVGVGVDWERIVEMEDEGSYGGVDDWGGV
jgi:hypothetical protein